ncbi:MAG: ABC transporter ATP-binding protein [Nitrososphaeria archaeon]|nr:ABC transporter ATP-binding protein [Nitrososphaeria archaeon]
MKLIVQNLYKKFKDIVAIKDVSLEVEEREYVVIIGPSGCGKSTLLKLIKGIILQDSGQIFVDGREVSALPPEDRDIGFVFQNILLFPHMNAYENISYSPIVKNFNPSLRKKFIEELILFGKLEEWKNLYPNQISSRGIQQKISLIRALATGSKLLLLDEPLSSLDARVRISIREEVRNIVKQLGITAVHVTHDQNEAIAIADKIVVMRGGSIIEVGSPEQLYNRPKNIFTAFFLGKGNFIEGKIVKSDDNVTYAKAGNIILESNSKFNVGEKVIIFFSPENVLLEKGDENNLKGEVVEKRFLGRQIEYGIRVENNIIYSRIMRLDDPKYNLGNKIELHIEKDSIIFYKYPQEGLEKAFKLE